MASLYARPGWHPKPGELVSGKQGKRLIRGTVVADPSNPRLPKVRAMGWGGCVLLFVKREDGKETGINGVIPVESELFPSIPQPQEDSLPQQTRDPSPQPQSQTQEEPEPVPQGFHRHRMWGTLVPDRDTDRGDREVDRLLAELNEDEPTGVTRVVDDPVLGRLDAETLRAIAERLGRKAEAKT